jgi:putative endonuclease
MNSKGGYVYIVTNSRNGTLYIGVTSDLMRRASEHKRKMYPNSFSAKYKLDKLVYYEAFADIKMAIRREKQLKDWDRNWKKDLIEKQNPGWIDLWQKFIDESGTVYQEKYKSK